MLSSNGLRRLLQSVNFGVFFAPLLNWASDVLLSHTIERDEIDLCCMVVSIGSSIIILWSMLYISIVRKKRQSFSAMFSMLNWPLSRVGGASWRLTSSLASFDLSSSSNIIGLSVKDATQL
jgi:hypothetical protein